MCKRLLATVETVASSSDTPVEFPKQAQAVLFCHAGLVSLTGEDVGIRESAEIVGTCSCGESFYRHKHSKIQV